MTKFQTLIFIPEGSLLDEKMAERNALQRTLKALGSDFGPAERLKYNDFCTQSKLLGLDERIEISLQNFCKTNLTEARKIFNEQIQLQKQLVKGVVPFLDEIQGKVKMVLLSKENKQVVTNRLAPSELLNYFAARYFKDSFPERLPNKNIFIKIIQEQELEPDSCLIIGTDLADEIQGAENANLQSLWVAPKKVKMPISPRPTLHLKKLNDLLFYLELS